MSLLLCLTKFALFLGSSHGSQADTTATNRTPRYENVPPVRPNSVEQRQQAQRYENVEPAKELHPKKEVGATADRRDHEYENVQLGPQEGSEEDRSTGTTPRSPGYENVEPGEQQQYQGGVDQPETETKQNYGSSCESATRSDPTDESYSSYPAEKNSQQITREEKHLAKNDQVSGKYRSQPISAQPAEQPVAKANASPFYSVIDFHPDY